MEWSCGVISAVLLLGEDPTQGISLFVDWIQWDSLVFRHLSPRLQLDGFQLCLHVQGGFCVQAFIVLIVTDQNSALGFPRMGTLTTPGENYFISTVEFSSLWSDLPPFFFDQAAIPSCWIVLEITKPLVAWACPEWHPGVCRLLSLCWCSWACSCVRNWSNWKITLHKNALQLPQNVKPQPWAFAGGGGWVVLEAFECWDILNLVRTPNVNLWTVCFWIPQDKWVFYQIIVLWSWKRHIPLIVGVYFLFHGWFP